MVMISLLPLSPWACPPLAREFGVTAWLVSGDNENGATCLPSDRAIQR